MSNTEEADAYDEWASKVQAQVDAAGAAVQAKRDAIETAVAASIASATQKQHDVAQEQDRQHQQNVADEERRHREKMAKEERRHREQMAKEEQRYQQEMETHATQHALDISRAEAERDAALADLPAIDNLQDQIRKARQKAMSFRQLHVLQGGSLLDTAPPAAASGGGGAVATAQQIKGREHWASDGARGLDDEKLFTVAPDSAEFQTVAARFAETLQTRDVDKIERVENGVLHEMFTLQQDAVSRQLHPSATAADVDAAQDVVQRTLFHGTQAVEQIVGSTDGQGFLPMLAGTSTGAVYGDGTYFARDASYSDGFARTLPTGQKQMLLVNVIVGRWTVGKQGMKVCPTVPGEQYARFNSLVNNVADPTIFVVQHSSQAYPTHLITYH